MNLFFHEIKKLSTTLSFWGITALTLMMMAGLFYHLLTDYQLQIQATLLNGTHSSSVSEEILRPYFGLNLLMISIIGTFIPVQLILNEKRKGDFFIYVTSPSSSTRILFSKYAAAFSYLICLQSLTFLPIFLLNFYNPMDKALLVSFELSMLLFGLVVLSLNFVIGLFVHSSVFGGFIGLLSVVTLSLIGWIPFHITLQSYLLEVSLLTHFYDLLQGTLNSYDIFYLLFLTGVLCSFAAIKLSWDRQSSRHFLLQG